MLGSLPIRTHPGPSLATPGMQGPSVSIQPLYPCSSRSKSSPICTQRFPRFCFCFFLSKHISFFSSFFFVFCLCFLKLSLTIFFILPRRVWFFFCRISYFIYTYEISNLDLFLSYSYTHYQGHMSERRLDARWHYSHYHWR